MSEENVEVVRKLFELAARGDWNSPELQDLYTQVMDPDLEFVLSGSWFPDPSVHRGVGAALQAYSGFLEAWEEITPSKPRLVDCGNRVVALYRIRGRGRGSGAPVETDVGSIATFRGGKIARLILSDRAEALEAAGLSE
jgi:ketosteroid isomerase-like protein